MIYILFKSGAGVGLDAIIDICIDDQTFERKYESLNNFRRPAGGSGKILFTIFKFSHDNKDYEIASTGRNHNWVIYGSEEAFFIASTHFDLFNASGGDRIVWESINRAYGDFKLNEFIELI